ncbi:hypothetical protein [Niabella sp.]|uniref:hypothetical protein n=1 Tax=Niabella sp. TaxID=1962976 RepID=UPI00260A9F1B|nr:hypothetical protein [Niabella sp.]
MKTFFYVTVILCLFSGSKNRDNAGSGSLKATFVAAATNQQRLFISPRVSDNGISTTLNIKSYNAKTGEVANLGKAEAQNR